MNLYQIIGEYQKETKEIIEELDLHNTLQIKYKQKERFMQDVPAKLSFIPGHCFGEGYFPNGVLSIDIAEPDPYIVISQGDGIMLAGVEGIVAYEYKRVSIRVTCEVDLELCKNAFENLGFSGVSKRNPEK